MGDAADLYDDLLHAKEIDDANPEPYNPFSNTCKFCGKTGLGWHQKRNGKWILISPKGTPHNCKERLTGFIKVKGKK